MSPYPDAGQTGADARRGPVTVLCAVVGPLEAVVVGGLAASPDAVDLTRRCADVAELLAASAAGLGRVAVVSADLAGLDRPVVAALHAGGTRVVALCPDAPWQHERMRAIGVDAVCVDADAASHLLDRVRSVDAAGAAPAGARDLGWIPDELDEPGAVQPGWVLGPDGGPGAYPGSYPGTDAEPGAPGSVVAVWGPTGAPGRSTVALNLAVELAAAPGTPRRARAARRARAGSRRGAKGAVDRSAAETGLLVDADTYAGALAQMTGLLDESSGLAAACRAAGHGSLTLHQLAALAPALTPQLRILTGIARASRWPELSAASLEVVWQECRRLARWTVIDCGFALESDEMLTYDTRAPQRNAATLSALAAADVVVVVGGADAVSVQRLVRALDDLRGVGVAAADQVVVVNRVRASAAGRSPGAALREALLRYANVADVHLVPDDQASCDAALLAGRTVAEVAPSSPVRRALSELADTVRDRSPARLPAGRVGDAGTEGGQVGAAAWSPTVAH